MIPSLDSTLLAEIQIARFSRRQILGRVGWLAAIGLPSIARRHEDPVRSGSSRLREGFGRYGDRTRTLAIAQSQLEIISKHLDRNGLFVDPKT